MTTKCLREVCRCACEAQAQAGTCDDVACFAAKVAATEARAGKDVSPDALEQGIYDFSRAMRGVA